MKKIFSGIILIFLLINVLMLAFKIQPVKSAPRTWTVDNDGPADFHSIQEAINAASEGDTISVYNGTYYENVFVNKTIRLIGENRETTIINGNRTGNVLYVVENNVTVNNFTITASQLDLWKACGIYVNSSNNAFLNNIIGENNLGIYFDESHNNSVSSNLMFNNSIGHYIDLSDNNIFKRNNLTNNGAGFYCARSAYNVFNENMIVENIGAAILVWQGYLCTFARNTIIGNGHGLWLDPVSSCLIIENSIVNNQEVGVRFHGYSYDNIVIGNNITGNTEGLFFHDTTGTKILYNTISKNERGLAIYGGSSIAIWHEIQYNNITNNMIGLWNSEYLRPNCAEVCQNNFINNSVQAKNEEQSSIQWNAEYPSGGNYWSDYTGLDLFSGFYQNLTGADGIGDTPYVIDEYNLDRYPLMNPCGPTYNVTVKAHCTTEDVDVSVGIDMDGLPTGYTTPHTFTGLTGNHTLAVPNTDANGHSFKHWNTGETTTNITVTAGRHITCTAYYQAKHALAITTTSGGTTNPSPGTHTYWEGTTVKVTAMPNISYRFDHWELDGNNVGTSNPIKVTMDADHMLDAVFLYWAFHDVAITNVTSSKSVVGQGYSVTINLSVENQGGFPETFNVTIHANTSIIYTLVNITLGGGNSTVVTSVWDTTSVAYGNYTLKATADNVPGETDTADNICIDGTVLVTTPGDVNGDRKVDMKDIYAMILRFGSKLGQPKYNPNCDINCNGVIDMVDIYIAIRHYGQKW